MILIYIKKKKKIQKWNKIIIKKNINQNWLFKKKNNKIIIIKYISKK